MPVRRRCAKIGAALEREVGVLADLQGPKIRIETFRGWRVELRGRSRSCLIAARVRRPATCIRVGVSYHGLPQDVHPGDVLLLDDGLLASTVLDVVGSEVRCRGADRRARCPTARASIG